MMATAEATSSPASVANSNGEDADPFNTTPRSRSSSHRYSALDTKLFSSYTQASPSQAKKTLEAHIADTDRRIREASKLGTSLLEQKRELSEHMKEVEQRQGSTEIGPELRQKLTELEKEYNDLGRESARAFIPKSRKTNLNSEDGSQPLTLAGESHPTPSRLFVPANPSSRKQRNSSSRIEDLAFATEISTSLLSQLRNLQNVLAEKEEQLRDANVKNAKLIADAETTAYKLRSLDENEQRYKDENWRLETQVQDLMMQAKEHTLREQKLTSGLDAAKSEKSGVERECDEAKIAHNKLSEEHAVLRKKHDTEIATMRRNAAAGDHEKELLQKKITELSSQNEDLAKAVAYRVNTERGLNDEDRSIEGEEMDLGNLSSEHSPPPSPTKGTPRHGGLESETLKSSLHHAHRMIQNLKNNIHREKTEKVELRRMLQDARDELEVRRADGTATAANAGKRRKPNAQDSFKKPVRPDKLGGAKSSREEFLDDPSWEEYDESPTKARGVDNRGSRAFSTDQSDGFETANERGATGTETDGFETAHEQDANSTETDAFETAESVAAEDTDGDLTETEATRSPNKKPSLRDLSAGVRSSFQSTASDDADLAELRGTPASQPPRYKLRLNRGAFRGTSETPSVKGSPASFVSNRSLPTAGQNLADELEDLGDDTSVADSTPSRSIASLVSSPDAQYKRDTVIQRSIESDVIRAQMVDSGTMTDTFVPEVSTSPSPTYADAVTFTEVAEDAATQPFIEDKEAPGIVETTSERSVAIAKEFETPADPVAEPVQLELSPIKVQHTEPIAPEVPPSMPRQTAIVKSSGMAAVPLGMAYVNQVIEKSPSTPSRFDKTPTSRNAGVQDFVAQQTIHHGGKGISIAKSENTDGAMFQARGPVEQSKRVPFQPVSGNAAVPKPSSNLSTPTKNEGTQTTVSSEQIDNLIKEKNRKPAVLASSPSPFRASSSSVRSMSMGARSAEQLGLLDFSSPKSPKRPGSAGSLRKGTISPPPQIPAPPLPSDHREVIAAASRTSSMLGSMPPPSIPASGFKNSNQQLRPRTPNGSVSQLQSPLRFGTVTSTARDGPPSIAERSDVTRRSSMSSFASEVEERFDMNSVGGIYQEQGFEMGTDPRMIQAITQTMIGEFMYKYTRKAGRGDLSQNRHRRFFWIHPYTRTLYWSTHDPSRANRSELKAKSVPIEAVRVVSDDNTNPPGLNSKSIVIITPGRSIKLTAPTSQRHETWFNALSYLLVRDNPRERGNEMNQQMRQYASSNIYTNTAPSIHERTNTISSLTSEDLSEFNPVSHGRSASRMTGGSQSYSHRSYGTSGSRTSLSMNRASTASLTSRAPSVHAPSLISRQPISKKSGVTTATPPANYATGKISEEHAQDLDSPTPTRATVDAQGFKKPIRPISLSTNAQFQSPAQASKSGRLSSLSGRLSRQSFFGRDRSSTQLSRGLDSSEASPATTPSKGFVARSKSLVRGGGARDPMEPSGHEHVHSTGGDGTSITMENVRACCDGKHDVGSLSHTHRRDSSRNRSHASLGSRASGVFGRE